MTRVAREVCRLQRVASMAARAGIGVVTSRLATASGFLAVWVVLAGGDFTYMPWMAAVALAAALAASIWLGPPRRWRWRPIAALRFAARFAWISVSGGLDVARRALCSKPAIDPELRAFELSSEPSGPAATLLVGVMSLVPGTLCAEVRGRQLIVHVIDRRHDVEPRLRSLEARVASIFAPGCQGEGSP